MLPLPPTCDPALIQHMIMLQRAACTPPQLSLSPMAHHLTSPSASSLAPISSRRSSPAPSLVRGTPTSARTHAVLRKSPSVEPSQRVVHVLDELHDYCYDVPREHVRYSRPIQHDIVALCRRLSQTGTCTHGAQCQFAHVDRHVLDECPKNGMHTNYAWRNADLVPYARHPPGLTLPVTHPRTGAVTEVDSSLVLVTQGSQSVVNSVRTSEELGVLRPQNWSLTKTGHLCVHYERNACCRLGSGCQFVHLVTIDPKAGPNQKAKRRKTKAESEASDGITAEGSEFSNTFPRSSSVDFDSMSVASGSVNDQSLSSSPAVRSLSVRNEPYAMDRCLTPSKADSRVGAVTWYSHDPYGLRVTRPIFDSEY